MSGINNNRIIFIDAIRIIACILVIAYHTRYYVYDFIGDGGSITLLNLYSVHASYILGRFGVPLFFIISGYFAFPIKYDTVNFIKRKLPRLLYPMMFWLLLSTILLGGTENYIIDFVTLKYASHLWYLIALISFIIVTPIISPFFDKCSKTEYHIYISIWLITLLFVNISTLLPEIISNSVGGISFKTLTSVLNPFYTYFGYMLVGGYLSRYDVSKLKCLLLCGLGIISVPFLFVICKLDLNDVISYSSFSIACISSAIFILIKRLFGDKQVDEKAQIIISKIGSYTYGIYLMHMLILEIVYEVFKLFYVNNIVIGILTFGIGMLIVRVIACLPFRKYIIG